MPAGTISEEYVMEHKRWRWVFLLLVMGVLFVIGWHSMQPGVVSHHESQRVLAMVRPWVQGTAIAPYVSDGTLRRLAHLAEYAMLGCTVSGVLLAYTGKSHTLWTLLIAVLVASLDEYIQQFSGGRTSTWHDVVLDIVGCMAGILFVFCIRTVYRLIKR